MLSLLKSYFRACEIVFTFLPFRKRVINTKTVKSFYWVDSCVILYCFPFHLSSFLHFFFLSLFLSFVHVSFYDLFSVLFFSSLALLLKFAIFFGTILDIVCEFRKNAIVFQCNVFTCMYSCYFLVRLLDKVDSFHICFAFCVQRGAFFFAWVYSIFVVVVHKQYLKNGNKRRAIVANK